MSRESPFCFHYIPRHSFQYYPCACSICNGSRPLQGPPMSGNDASPENSQSNHTSNLLKNFNSLRQEKILTDVIISIEDKKYELHKVVLAASSDFFRTMFTIDMVDKQKDEINLFELSQEGFEVISEFMYTSVLSINKDNIMDVLTVADYLMMKNVVHSCAKFLENSLDFENCIEIMRMADNFRQQHLKNLTLKYMCSHIKQLYNNSKWIEISLPQLVTLLNSDFPLDCTEFELFKFVLGWFVETPTDQIEDRTTAAHEVLQHIRFQEINPFQLKKTIQSFARDQKGTLWAQTIQSIINEIVKTDSSSPNKHYISPNFSTRGVQKALINVGGYGAGGITNELGFLVEGKRQWKRLTLIPHIEQINFGITVLNNELFIAGGLYNEEMQEVVHNYCFKYSPRTDSWQRMQPLIKDRCRFTLTGVGDYLYAVGGEAEHDAYLTETVTCERYDIKNNKWEEYVPLPDPHSQHAACHHRMNNKDYIFISGGFCRGEYNSDILRFDIENQQWEHFALLSVCRIDHTMFSYGGKLYLVGGTTDQDDVVVPVHNIEVFNPETKTYEVIGRIERPRAHSSFVLDGTKLWVLGGYGSDRQNNFLRRREFSLYFDLEKKEWNEEQADQLQIWEHSSVILYVPKEKAVASWPQKKPQPPPQC